MNRTDFALLEFKPDLNKLSKKKELRQGLSVVVQVGDTLWVANDETITLERLSRQTGTTNGGHKYGEHKQFALNDYLRLPVPPPSDPDDIEEADVEGLDYDRRNSYLWLVSSHSLKRGHVDRDRENVPVKKKFDRLAEVSGDGNRFLLARIPVVKEDGMWTLKKKVERGPKNLTAAQLHADRERVGKGNDLTHALAKDDHLYRFLSIPSKDNGLDVEGLAVSGERVFLGLRGPLLRGWAVILELELEEDDASTLKMKKIGPDDQPYRKHFLQLRGLGIRDLCAQGADLLILAGPTMDLDGPVTIFRWPGGAQPSGESINFDKRLPVVLDIPFGQDDNRGTDHAEGMTLFSPTGGDPGSVLVVYDSASQRRQQGTSTVEADIFALPA